MLCAGGGHAADEQGRHDYTEDGAAGIQHGLHEVGHPIRKIFSVSQKYLPGLSTPRRARAACRGCPHRTGRSRRCRSTTRSPATSAGSTRTGAGPGPGAAAASAQVRTIELETKVREDFTIIEKVPARALSWLKVPTRAISWLQAPSSTFTFKTQL